MLFSFLAQATEWIMESFMEIANLGERVKFRGKVMRFILDMLSQRSLWAIFVLMLNKQWMFGPVG